MKKITGLTLLLVTLTLLTTHTVNAASFSDIKTSDWYYNNVKVLVDKDIITGYPDGSFKPEDKMNVDAFIKTMVVALGEDPGNADGYWAQNYIDKAKEMGILKTSDFNSTTKMITRADMSKLAVRTAEKLEGKKTYKYNPTTNDPLYKSITDTADIKDLEDKQFIVHAYELGLITGYPDGSYKPYAGLKRSEACTVIRRVIETTQRKPYTEPVASEWDIRAEEVYKKTGIRPFDNTTTDLDEGIITEYELRNIQKAYHFKSYLSYNSEDSQRDDWGITVIGPASVNKIKEGSFETELFELEYIFRHIHNVDATITKEVIAELKMRITGVSTPLREWNLDNGAIIEISASGKDIKIINVTAINYEF